MRLAVRATACFHCAPDSRSTRPVRIAASTTPVPAADSQLIVNFAASGLAPPGRGRHALHQVVQCGISQTGSDNGPPNFEPKSVR